MRKYTRDDVEYETFYSRWMKDLARNHTKRFLESMYEGKCKEADRHGRAHLRAIEATTSMTGQSARRAHSRNNAAASGEYEIALSGAIEIHDLFPEHAHENT
jgi:hypothetical protein